MKITEHAASLAAGAAIVAVLVVVGGLTVWSFVQSHRELDAVSRSVAVSNAYRDAVNAASLAQLYATRFVNEHDPALRSEFEKHLAAAFEAAERIKATGGPEDRALIDDLETQLKPQIERALTILSSLTPEQLSAVNLSGQPLLGDLNLALGEPAERRHQQAVRALDSLRDGDNTRSLLAMLAFGIGMPAVLLLRRQMDHYEKREAANRLEVDRMRAAALTDSLTALGNHRAFQEELQRLVTVTARSGQPLTVVMMDIDDFKLVNDANGHAGGDRVLAEVAGLMTFMRPEDRAFRVGGDEFAYLMPGVGGEDAFAYMESLLTLTAKTLDGVSLSAGVACTGSLTMEPDALRERADMALYEAKRRGKNQVVDYDAALAGQDIVPSAKSRALRDLLQTGELDIVFQPIVRLDSGQTMAFEALARPRSPELVHPEEAFEVADRLGRSWDLDMLCLSKVFAAAPGLPPEARIFVNLDPRSLTNPAFSADGIVSLAGAHGIRPSRVVIELTERTAIGQRQLLAGLDGLRAAGFRVALDDVGAGNSGLELLRSARFDFVKIDRSVIASALETGSGRAIVSALVALGSELGAEVIAEGVENEAMLDAVRMAAEVRPHLGAIGVQGFLFGWPQSADGAVPPAPAGHTRAA